jgi:hypothetical protein
MSISSVAPTVTQIQTPPPPPIQPGPSTGLAGVTQVVKPPHHHGGGHGPSTQPVPPSTTTDGGLDTLA